MKHQKQGTYRGHMVRGLFLAALLLLFCWRAVQASWLFALEHIDVFGNETLSSQQIEEIAGVWRGSQLLKIDLLAMEKKLLSDPRITSVQVSRVFPNRLRVDIEENIGIAVAIYHDSFVEFDRSGKVVSIIGNFSRVNLPIVTGINLTKVRLGDKLSGEGFDAALAVLSHIPVTVRSLVSEVNVSVPSCIIIWTTDGICLKIGNATGVQTRLALLPAVLYAYEVRGFSRENIAEVDMSGETPVFKGR